MTNINDLRLVLEELYFYWQLGSYQPVIEMMLGNIIGKLQRWGYWRLCKEWCDRMLPHAEGIYYRICVQFLGGICRDTGDWDGAEKWFQKSLAHAEAADNLGGIGTSLGLLGDIARKRGAYDKAEALFNQSLAVQTELGDRAGMATSWGSLGENELERGNLEAAETWLIKALLVFEELQMPDMLAEVNWVLARIYHAKGEPSKAQEYFDHAHEPYTQLGAKADLARIDQEANANG